MRNVILVNKKIKILKPKNYQIEINREISIRGWRTNKFDDAFTICQRNWFPFKEDQNMKISAINCELSFNAFTFSNNLVFLRIKSRSLQKDFLIIQILKKFDLRPTNYTIKTFLGKNTSFKKTAHVIYLLQSYRKIYIRITKFKF